MVTAATREAAEALAERHNRLYGMPRLPGGSTIVGTVVTVERR
jgi:hypothetical protein